MKKLLIVAVLIGSTTLLSGCYEKVEAGNVGVKVNLLGSDKGVQQQVVGVGRYWLGINEELYTFPTFNQLYTYPQPFGFQTSDSMSISARVGVEYHVDPDKVAKVFQTYRKGLDEITSNNLRQKISDALIKHGSSLDINSLANGGKAKMLEDVTEDLRREMSPVGIIIDKLSWTGDLDYPDQVKESINAKIKATQMTAQRENEVAQSKAEAQKAVEEARGIAESNRIRAEAEANAITMRGQALRSNPEVLQLEAINRWDGKTPVYVAGSGSAAVPPFVNFSQIQR
jgi:regulator of protease activity HflC (stomatin/prohibitin superfamily)